MIRVKKVLIDRSGFKKTLFTEDVKTENDVIKERIIRIPVFKKLDIVEAKEELKTSHTLPIAESKDFYLDNIKITYELTYKEK